jgi:hypothetical protein
MTKMRAEIDGGDAKPSQVKAHRRDRCFVWNRGGERNVLVMVREYIDNRYRQFSVSESQAASLIPARIVKGTVVQVDEAHHGIICMSVSRSSESTIRRHTASMARALT